MDATGLVAIGMLIGIFIGILFGALLQRDWDDYCKKENI
jgi:uncharacterized membrane-anchored protein YhcB (DUF1043 family)